MVQRGFYIISSISTLPCTWPLTKSFLKYSQSIHLVLLGSSSEGNRSASCHFSPRLLRLRMSGQQQTPPLHIAVCSLGSPLHLLQEKQIRFLASNRMCSVSLWVWQEASLRVWSTCCSPGENQQNYPADLFRGRKAHQWWLQYLCKTYQKLVRTQT